MLNGFLFLSPGCFWFKAYNCCRLLSNRKESRIGESCSSSQSAHQHCHSLPERFLAAVFVLHPGNSSMPSIFSVLTLQALLLGVPRLLHYNSFSQWPTTPPGNTHYPLTSQPLRNGADAAVFFCLPEKQAGLCLFCRLLKSGLTTNASI